MAKANKLIPVVDGTAGTPIELTDSRIEITNPAANDLLQYDSTQQQFVNTPASSVVPSHRTVNHEQITDSSLGDINLHDGFYFPNAVQDYDGNWYGAVVIGDQVWLGENLRTTHYADGTAIPKGTGDAATPQYNDYTTSTIPLKKRGLLYNWYAVMNGASSSDTIPSGVQGVAPTGWHVPSYSEVDQLKSYVNNQIRFRHNGNSGETAKSFASTLYWSSSNNEGVPGNNQSTNNATGFNLYPAGRLNKSTFGQSNLTANLATTYSYTTNKYYGFSLYYATNTFYGQGVDYYVYSSVRCVSDLTPLQFRDWYVKTYGTLQHKLDELPSMSGNSGKVLAVNGTETDVEWVSTQECMWYGVRKDRSNDSTTLERIGNLEMHKTLPIQSKMRRCLLLDNGTVNYYLSGTDSTKKEDGVTAAVLDGTDGQVMVEIPEHYVMYDTYTDEVTGHVINEWKISECPLPGFTKVNKCYYSAYEAALDRTNNKLSSVVNTTAQYRGGNNTSSWDGTYRSLLGMPATNKSLADFRTYARNRGSRWTCHDNNMYTDVCTLYLVEYANTNIQLPFNAALTQDGYHQGGLGSGVSEMTDWSAYNSSNPVTSCGVTVTLGNATGVVTHNVIASDGTTVKYAAPVPSYRGIENLFGHLWKHTDGILVNIQSASAGGVSQVYVCNDITKYSSSITTDYTQIGNEARSSGYAKNVLFPYLISSGVSADSSTGWADYHSTAIPSSGSAVWCVLWGGSAQYGTKAGFACEHSDTAPSYANANVGSRLCYTPATIELPPLEGNSGKVLAVNSGETDVEWVTQSGGGGASQLNDLSDVTISSAASGQALLHNGTNWVNGVLPQEVLVCSYDTSNNTMDKTPAEIVAAKAANKIVICKLSYPTTDFLFLNQANSDPFVVFTGFSQTTSSTSVLTAKYHVLRYTTTDSWKFFTFNIQQQLVSGTNIKTINGNSLLGSGDLVIGGVTIYSGSTAPSLSTGSNGDIYIQTVS